MPFAGQVVMPLFAQLNTSYIEMIDALRTKWAGFWIKSYHCASLFCYLTLAKKSYFVITAFTASVCMQFLI